ncbi:MAG: glycogen/starch synthase, partial [Planctomycetota bacterium]
MNIVYLTTEAVPFAKTGGLADVCGTLPSEVAALGHDCAVIMPAFASIHRTSQTIEPTSLSFAIPMGESRVIGCRVLKSTLPVRPSDNDDQDGPVQRVPVYFIDQPQYYDRPSLYGDATGDYHDNAERFAFFCRAALVLIEQLRLDVDVLHCNDWQTGLIPALCRIAADEGTSPQSIPRTVFTIHNLA